ncbi:zinc ribbon domain-containing protein [Oleiharenicola lentus]|uniref:zinc ribbon domain-containing protein n=1 Tax=Oleiharenicola lentus TaxID=2508720 RepID=UPI003F669D1C
MSSQFVPPSECPVCGERVPRGAKACPGCGADERSGWNDDDTRYDGLDLPAEAFTDDDAPQRKAPRSRGKLWLVVAVVLIVLFVLGIFLR